MTKARGIFQWVNGFLVKHKVPLIIIFVFFMLVFSHAGSKSYWLDELYSVYMRGTVHKTFSDHFAFIQKANPTIPLYEITLYSWMKIFGDSEVSTRTLSIIFVSFSALFLYLFTLRIFSKRIALMTLLLYLFSYLTIRYALDARYYSQMLFLTTLSSYLLLLFTKSLTNCFLWENIFINKYFLFLTIVNVALILNHSFNYFFLFIQALFMALFMFFLKTNSNWISIIFKVFLMYLAPLILVVLLWPPAMNTLLDPGLTGHSNNSLMKVSHSLSQNIGFANILFSLAGLITIFFVMFIILRKLVRYFLKNKLLDQDSKQQAGKLTFLALILIIFIGVFFLDIGAFFGDSNESLSNPSKVFFTSIMTLNFFLPRPVYFVLILLIFFSFGIHLKELAISILTENRISLNRRLFLLYLATLILLTSIFTSVIFSVNNTLQYFPRYLLFLLPPFSIFLSLTAEQGFLLFAGIIHKLTRYPMRRFYVKNVFIFSVLITFFLVGPRGYWALTHYEKNSWREISKQIVNLISADTSHTYLIVQERPRNFPLMDYYFEKYSENIRVDIFPQTRWKSAQNKTDNIELLLFNEKDLKLLENYDFMIVAFIHYGDKGFLEKVNSLNRNIHLKFNGLDENGKGILVFDLQPQHN